MRAPETPLDNLPSHKTRSGRWIFRGVIMALVAVVLLPFVVLALFCWRVQAERAALKELDAGPWFVVEDSNPSGVRPNSQFDIRLRESLNLPTVRHVAVQLPRDPRVKEGFALLARITQVEELDFSGAPLTDGDLQTIGHRRGLTELNLAATDITDAAMAIVADLPNIRELDLSATEVTDEALRAIANMKVLQSLKLWYSKVTTGAIKRLRAQRPDLIIAHSAVRDSQHFAVVREIIRRGCELKDIDGSASMTFDGHRVANDWSGFDWSRLRDVPRIWAIQLSEFDQSGEVLSQLRHFSDLRVLSLGTYAVPRELLEQITQCTGLEHLALSDSALRPTDFQAIKELKQLQTLRISGEKIGPAELGAIASLPLLTDVRLDYCQFEPGVFGSIAPPSQWVKLNASSGNLTDADVEDITHFKSLKDVDLFANPAIVSDSTIDKLLAMPLLERASVGMSVTPEGLARLNQALKQRRD